MQIPKINIKQSFNSAKQSLQKTGAQATQFVRNTDARLDKFITSKGKDYKTVKQIGLGAVLTVAGLAIATKCIQGIVKKVKQEIEEK